MSLDWHLPCDKHTPKHRGREVDHEEFRYTDHLGERSNWAEATCLVWTQLGLMFDTANNPLNEDNFKECWRRLYIMNKLHWSNTFHVNDPDVDGVGKTHKLKATDLINLWGLWTNCGHKSKREWNSWLVECLGREAGESLSHHRDHELCTDIKDSYSATKKVAEVEATQPRFYCATIQTPSQGTTAKGDTK